MKYCRICKSDDIKDEDFDYIYEVCKECYIDKTRIH